jgi:hypothetical protein
VGAGPKLALAVAVVPLRKFCVRFLDVSQHFVKDSEVSKIPNREKNSVGDLNIKIL